MKLVMYSHYFAPSVGGVENIVMSLARGLSELRSPDGRQNFDVTLVTETAAGEFQDSALPFRVVRCPKVAALWRVISGADTLHLSGPALMPLLMGWWLRKPTVIEHHGYQAICPNGLLIHHPERSVCPGHFQAGRYGKCLRCQAREMSWLRSAVNLLLMIPRNLLTRRAARNIAVTQHVLKRHGLPRSTVIYHGVADGTAGNAVRSAEPGKISFAYVGRFVREKGIATLLRATKILVNEGPSFDLQLIGDGPERENIEDVIRREGLDGCVHITGYRTGEALTQAVSKADVVIMPSEWEETAGLSAIEQMMRGKLVIASDIGGLAEVVGDAGLKFPSGDARALAECMRKVLRDHSLVMALGEGGRRRATSLFSRERMIADHARMYGEGLSGAISAAGIE